ncbi:TonB-dependent receptor plug domain-containing protein [Providencia vermicola]|uniref:TonB-dependent receptor plug domain-containing protein n=1 Tax=Providencia vermicola TaxID=333965 RepID=UPI001CECEDFE|nr:TonB-dependent receptor plug domain-containing protein [Providencia vermicola]
MKVKIVIAINIATGLSLCCMPSVLSAQLREDVGSIQVNDKANTIKQRDKKKADEQYDKDESNIYIGKEEVERYKGSNPADTINHAVGVYSGDARNSGALDPNVRGIQGQGRVPVTVDGTEQAITVWRGYNGANNRNYIDPNMISSILVMKSATLDRDVRTSTGGGIAISTIGIDDVVNPDDKFGFDIKLETSSNTTKPRLGTLNHGIDYRDDKRFIDSLDYQTFRGIYFQDQEVLVNPHTKGSANFFNLQDNAARIAVGTRQEKFNVTMAYSVRRQGNYFAGSRGAEQYDEEMITYNGNYGKKQIDPYIPFAAKVFGPNKEVSNTSAEMSTWLAKLNFMLPHGQDISFGYYRTGSHYGEIMPSKIRYHDLNGKVVQWPLANLTLNTFYANYAFKPDAHNWVDFRLSYWLTRTDLNSNTAGGQPREPFDRDWQNEFKSHNRPRDPNIDGTLVDGIKLNQLNNRHGVSLSNKFQLAPDFSLTLMGNLIDEHIGSRVDVYSSRTTPKSGMFRAVPREGQRREYNGAVRVDWQPTDWLKFNAGAQYISYWSKDTLKERRVAAKDERFALNSEKTARNFQLSRVLTVEEYQKIQSYVDRKGQTFEELRDDRTFDRVKLVEEALGMPARSLEYADFWRKRGNKKDLEFRILETNRIVKWQADENKRFVRKNNPFYNGEIDLKETVVDPVTQLTALKYRASDAPNRWDEIKFEGDERFRPPKRKEDAAWAPALGATIYVTENDRIFARYLETVRMPSIFESTVGFSGGSVDNYIAPTFLPERSHTIELGYVRNFQEFLNAQNHADLRVNYYNTVVANAFDRDMDLNFTQVDKHNTAGVELLARYDNGSVFGDVGFDYRLKNEVCDQVNFMLMDPKNEFGGSECITAGFPGGYLRTQLQPKYSIHANFGLRFLDETLEVGSRMRYHSTAKNEDEAEFMDKYPYQFMPLNNSPMRWNAVFTTDAYANFHVNKNLSLEFIATNLLDEYYIDPLTRSMMPAPGRTFRFSVTSKF